MIINLRDESLFGNEAAEDEKEDIFASYAYERPEVNNFTDPNKALQIARAYKGEGKSALMRIVRGKIESHYKDSAVTLSLSGADVSPESENRDFSSWVREWKEKILCAIATELGSKIGLAISDDAISLVELSEKEGVKPKNFISSCIHRLKTTYFPVEVTVQPASHPEKLLSRWMSNAPLVWVFLDDIDRNFDGSKAQRKKVAALFDACREIVNRIDGIRFRLTIRPGTWILTKREHESMSHSEQYTCDLSWNEYEMLQLLARRIYGYLRRNDPSQATTIEKKLDTGDGCNQILSLVFENPVRWNNKMRPIITPLFTLGHHRPRWVVELCRVSAEHSAKLTTQKIFLNHISDQLGSFGGRRIDDTVAEYKVQCKEIHDLIHSFRNSKEEYSTAQFIDEINSRIISRLKFALKGTSASDRALDVASFLFQIGFIYARKDHVDGSYTHYSFSEKPNMFLSQADPDEGCRWEIPPVFRQALGIRGSNPE